MTATPCGIGSDLAGINPPIPRSVSKNEGSRLLTVIRLLEQDDRTDNERHLSLLTECVEILRTLAASTQRRGLLGENLDLADQVLSSTKASSSRKRGRSVGSSNGKGQSDASSALQEDGAARTGTLDTSLVLQGLARILVFSATPVAEESDRYLLVALVGDICTSSSEYIQASRTSKATRCSQAEFELLNSFPLVTSFQSFIQNAFATFQCSSSGLYSVGNDELTAAMISSFRAASSLVRLLATRLSRTSLDSLTTVAWQALAVLDSPDVQRSASTLLSTLPVHRTTTAENWLLIWNEASTALMTALSSLAPIVEISITSGSSVSIPPPVNLWIQAIQRGDLESDRMASFLWLLRGLARVLQGLLGENHPAMPPALIVQLDVVSTLDLIETVISFGSSAEGVYFGTKKRLRAETVGRGAFSATALAQMANSIKVRGLELLSTFVEAVGGPSLLPFSDRFYNIASVAVRTSCSMSLRSALEPGSDMSTSNQRWLNSSVSARSNAIRSFELCLITFGCQLSSTGARNSQQFDGTLTFVAGTLIEVLTNTSVRDGGNWGSFSERAQLLQSCADCLKAALVSYGDYLAESTRHVSDSVVYTCLRALIEGTNPAIRPSSVRRAILSMGTAGVTTCWSNGASSSLATLLEKAARSCQGDRDATVVASASCALSTCAALSNPRVPAIYVVKGAAHGVQEAFSSRILSPDALLERLETARVDAARKYVEDAKNANGTVHSKGENLRVDQPEAKLTSFRNVVEEKAPEATMPDTSAQVNGHYSTTEKDGAPAIGTSLSILEVARASLKFADEDDADDDDELPMIVDAGPDEDDAD